MWVVAWKMSVNILLPELIIFRQENITCTPVVSREIVMNILGFGFLLRIRIIETFETNRRVPLVVWATL